MNDIPQGRPDLPPGMTGYVPPHIPQPTGPYGQQGPYGQPPREPSPPPNAFSIASMVFGILSVASICFIYITPIFAGLAILFALLSKGYQKNMHGFSLAGIISSSAALSISVFMLIFIFVMAFRMMDDVIEHPEQLGPEYWRRYKDMGERIYGDDFDDLLKDIYGEDFNIDNYIE